MRNRISQVPDDILVNVVSLLTLKEAGRTSVLSKRWRHMWVYNPTLNFDYPNALHWDIFDTELKKVGKPKYVDWVDKVVDSHKAPAIDEFRVCADINLIKGRDRSKSIDNWFRFAMAKRVQRLQINLCPYRNEEAKAGGHTFPTLPLCNSLTSLKLGCIDINGKTLESFLGCCKSLEYLSVIYSRSLKHLKVCGPSLNLKHLKIYSHYEMKELEISAPKLESICYWGPKINVQFKSTPNLVKVYIGRCYADGLETVFSDLSDYLSQIKSFRIDCIGLMHLPVQEWTILFTRLEKLDMVVLPYFDTDLYFFTLMIDACPFLRHFKLRLYPLPPRFLRESFKSYSYCTTREQNKWETCPHYHLEILEILGFMGFPIDLEFVAYIVDSAQSLNKIIADTRLVPWMGTPRYFKDSKARRRARKQAKLLRANIKRGTKLEIV